MPHRRFLSLDVKLPLLMAAIVILATAVFATLAFKRFETVLYESHGERLRSSAQLLAQLFSDGLPATRAQLAPVVRHADVRRVLAPGARPDPRADSLALEGAIARLPDTTRVRFRLLDRTGVTRAELRAPDAAFAPSWAESVLRGSGLARSGLTVSPIQNAGSRAQYELVVPVHARDDGESLIGYYVETRNVRARGVDAIRRLTGSSTLLVGQAENDVWTDLDSIELGPPTIIATDSILIFEDSPRGPGVGVAQAVRGAPWVVWLQMSRAQVLAPIDDFLLAMLPLALLVASVGTAVAWGLGRRISRRVSGLAEQMHHRDATPVTAETPVFALRDRLAALKSRDELDELESAFRSMAERSDRHAQMEAQLVQAQKLEAVGRLAGGIAHDFNNMLTVVSNYGEMVAAHLPPGSEPARDMEEVLKATDRAARLTRQLLAFSRRQVLQPVVLDLNAIVRDAHRMLERLLASNVEVVTELSDDVAPVLADPGQLEQVMVNLALNAADAMPTGGRLVFSTRNADLEDLPAAPEEARAGSAIVTRFAQLTVRDTGHGMDRETASRAFEPFFSTKPLGKGTGLGLASVHGIVTQLGGRIWLYSEPGSGTALKIFLPVTEGAPQSGNGRAAQRVAARGAGAILLVEDDPATREVTRRLLVAHGFVVDAVESPTRAIELLAVTSPLPSLVLSDVMMPGGMSGVDLAHEVRNRRPDLPVVLTTGYVEAARTAMAEGLEVLVKPYPIETLSAILESHISKRMVRRSAKAD
jgi:signal transduction histidine kinase/CheY-like chemotaxis protein